MFTIQKYSHFFKVHPPTFDHIVREYLTAFAAQYVTRSFIKDNHGNQVLKPTHVYAARTKDKSEYRFHINQLPELLSFLQRRSVDIGKLDIVDMELHTPIPFVATIKPEWVLRDYQQEGVDYIVKEDHYRTKLIELATGSGKGKLTMFGLAKKGFRTLVVILPRYIDKWVAEVYETYNIDPKRLMVVQGSGHLRGLISMAQEGELDADIIIISSATYQNWLTDYEAQEYYDYPINPDQLHQVLGTGILLVDETHQHLHVIYRILMYTHTHLMIGMTATLITDQYDVRVIHNIMYPPQVRFNNLTVAGYTDVIAYSYTTHDIKKSGLRTTEWKGNTYSHNAYEKSILQKHYRLEKYLAIIDFTLGHSFLDSYQQGDRCAIFASTIKMCDAITKYLKQKYPQYDIRRYAENDPFENAIDPDIRVTTIGSMGTAIDIPKLRTVVLTVSISSIQANIQVLGRLRKLPDRDTRFAYIYNEDIRKHVDYHQKRRELFKSKVKSYKSLRLPMGM